MSARQLRAAPDPERASCWCGGWGHFFNTAFDPPQLTYCGNCEDAAEPDEWKGLSELEQDLKLARLGDYPGAEGCKRIAAAYDALAALAPIEAGTDTTTKIGVARRAKAGSAPNNNQESNA